MKLFFTKNFIRNYRALPQHVQKTIDKQLDVLLSDKQHPSLNIKKMQGHPDLWEGRVTNSYRFTFQINGETYILRKVGTHDILNNP